MCAGDSGVLGVNPNPNQNSSWQRLKAGRHISVDIEWILVVALVL